MVKKKKAEKSDQNMEIIEQEIDKEIEESKQIAESKAEKFVRLAKKRVSRTLKDFVSIAKLSNKNNYSYDIQQVKQIVEALKVNLSKLEAKFSAKEQEKPVFEF